MNLIRADKNDSLQTVRNGWYSYRAPTLEDKYLKGDPFPGIKDVTEFDEFITYARENLGLRIYDIAENTSSHSSSNLTHCYLHIGLCLNNN